MRKLVWLAVLAFLAWFFFLRPADTHFGCDAAGAVAHAATEDCPASLTVAATDPAWAARRLATIADRQPTVGLAYEEDGTETEFTSGEDDDADRVNDILDDAGVPYPTDRGGDELPRPAVTHVEPKVAARMRDEDIQFIVLVINNDNGVCGRSYGCRNVLGTVLPAGTKLVVWSPPTIQTGKPDVFIGGPQ